MIRVGQIGMGFMGTMHANVYQELEKIMDIKVVAIADLEPDRREKFASMFGAKQYANAQELIDNAEVDVVDITLPTYIHAEYAIKAMEMGYHVFIEKPVCLKPEEGAQLLAVQERTQKQVMVGQCLRLWPEYMYLKKTFDEKIYGQLKNLVLRRTSSTPTTNWHDWIVDESLSGGACLDLHIHDVDFARYLLGEPNEIKVIGDKNHAMALYDYGKTKVSIEGGWDMSSPDYGFRVQYIANFETGQLVYENDTLTVYPKNDKPFVPELDGDCNVNKDAGGNISSLGAYYNELKYFYECLLNGKQNTIAPLSEGVKSVEQVYREMENGGY